MIGFCGAPHIISITYGPSKEQKVQKETERRQEGEVYYGDGDKVLADHPFLVQPGFVASNSQNTKTKGIIERMLGILKKLFEPLSKIKSLRGRAKKQAHIEQRKQRKKERLHEEQRRKPSKYSLGPERGMKFEPLPSYSYAELARFRKEHPPSSAFPG